jgi:hypothetical protein
MAHPRLEGINANVQSLMGVEDEGIWKAEGLSNSVDTLRNNTSTLKTSLNPLSSPSLLPKRLSTMEYPPSVNLPGLSDFTLENLPCSPSSVLREKPWWDSFGSLSGKGIKIHHHRGGRHLWRPNKVVCKMVLGLDICLS